MVQESELERLSLIYENDAVLVGNGGIFEQYIADIQKILEGTFGFSGLGKIVFTNPKDFKPHLDGEVRQKQNRKFIENAFKGKYVFFVNTLKAFDNRLEYKTREIVQRIEDLGIHDEGLDLLLHGHGGLEDLVYPDMENKIAARFGSTRFNPASVFLQLLGQIFAGSEHIGDAKHISVVMPKAIFDWSHNFWKNWNKKAVYEMPSYHITLKALATFGAHSVLTLHPHAPKEGFETASDEKLNFVAIYPQTHLLVSNGCKYSIQRLFCDNGIRLDDPNFDPFKHKMDKDLELIPPQYRDRQHLMRFIVYTDDGGRDNALAAAQRFGLQCVGGKKDRIEAGKTTKTFYEPIEPYVLKLRESGITDCPIILYVLDDMINTGDTANKDALLRKDEIVSFNRQLGTTYQPFVDLVVSHIVNPELPNLQHDNLDRITVMNTTAYLPHGEHQLRNQRIRDKFVILNSTPHQLAILIAAEYITQKFHVSTSRNWRSTHRINTDQYLTQEAGYGL